MLTKLREYLDAHGVRYIVISHSRAYTATETAEAAHIRGGEFAKVTVVKIDGALAMVVLPASSKVDLDLLSGAVGGGKVELAHEYEFQDRFPDCELGAMPPFGQLYGMKVYVEEALTKNPRIAFNAGSHTDLVQMKFGDFQQLVQPILVRVSTEYTA